MKVENLNEDEREEYEERAGIMEFDGGFSREHAEHLAMQIIKQKRVVKEIEKLQEKL